MPRQAPRHRPFVLIAVEGQKQVIAAVNPAAAHEGLAPGMALTQARAILPQIAVAAAQPLEDAKALRKLAAGCLRFSPWVTPLGNDGLWIEATGVSHLFSGEQVMLEKIARVLKRNGLSVRLAMADTPGAAWAWAHYGAHPLTLAPQRAALDALPIAALRVSADTVQSLWRVGLRTIGALKAIPRATLPLRFGKDLLLRLDQALGHANEPIDPLVPHEARRREIVFPEPISTAQDIARTTAHLVHRLCGLLEEKQEGARKLDLVFRRTDNHTQAIRVGTARASRNPAHLLKLFRDHLETVAPGFGIDAVSLTAWRVAPLQPTQTESDGSGAQNATDLAMLADSLANRIGARQVYRLAPHATHIPERAQTHVAPMTDVKDAWPAQLPRPVRLFSPPEPVVVTALLPDHPPAQFSWRGKLHKIRCADGPERLFGEWWLSTAERNETRDYFQVEDEDGGRYWLFRGGCAASDPAPRWYLHGIFS